MSCFLKKLCFPRYQLLNGLWGVSATLAGKEIASRPEAGVSLGAGGEGSEHRAAQFAAGGRMQAYKKQEGALQLGIGLLDHILH